MTVYTDRIKTFVTQTLASDFVRKVMETFATRIFLILLSLATTVIVTRILGPEGRGLYAVAVAIGAIGVQFGNLGLHASNTYYVAQDRSRLPALLGNTLVISFLVGSLGSGLAWCVFIVRPELAPLNGNLLILALIWIPVGLTYLLVQNLLIGIQEIRTYNLIEIVTKIISVILIALFILMEFVTVESIFTIGLVTLIIGLAWSIIMLNNHLTYFPKLSFDLFKGSIRYGFKAYLAAFFAFMVLKVDLLMVQYMLGPEQAGYYSIAASLADMVYMLPVVVGTILFPKLSELDDPEQKWRIARKSAYSIFFIMTVVTVISALLSGTIIKILFGSDFEPSVSAFIWLMPGVLFISVNTIFMNYFGSLGMPAIVVYSPAFASVINILCNYELIPKFGIIGASISSLISYGLMLFFSLIFQCIRSINFVK